LFLQREVEGCAFVHIALGTDLAAVMVDYSLCRGEADAETRKVGCWMESLERGEQPVRLPLAFY
jgi:hypothetical protein